MKAIVKNKIKKLEELKSNIEKDITQYPYSETKLVLNECMSSVNHKTKDPHEVMLNLTLIGYIYTIKDLYLEYYL